MDRIDNTPYREIEIPAELSSAVEDAIAWGQASAARRPRRTARRIASVAAVFCICFVGLLNLSPAFAAAMGELPVVGDVCKIFTFRTYADQTPIHDVEVAVPQIDAPETPDYEAQLNLEISRRVDEATKAAEQRAQDYYDAFVATGGDPADFQPVEIRVDYEVKSANESFASFVITKTESFASAYNEQIFYNLDLETGKLFTLRDWLGPDYQTIVAQSIEKQIASWSEEQRALLFAETEIADHISENTDFYLTEDGQVVVVFPKYEIAAGAAGILEFPIEVSEE
jgi:hypothetical protein